MHHAVQDEGVKRSLNGRVQHVLSRGLHPAPYSTRPCFRATIAAVDGKWIGWRGAVTVVQCTHSLWLDGEELSLLCKKHVVADLARTC